MDTKTKSLWNVCSAVVTVFVQPGKFFPCVITHVAKTEGLFPLFGASQPLSGGQWRIGANVAYYEGVSVLPSGYFTVAAVGITTIRS
jgi:hypothetical protein